MISSPLGNYRFRADLNGTQFWSADENTCTLPGCITDSVAVTKPVNVTVAGEEGNPYNEVTVYAFDGETYSGYSAVTDGGGQVTFTLPEGSYHFRADFDGVQFWSNNENSCTIPGCEEDSVILPGGTGEQEVSIDYTYDALNRLISAEYSNGTAFGYTYDAAGNVLTYAETHYGQTMVTTYTYDAANQLLTAVEDDPSTGSGQAWQYSYDGNGSLIQTNPGASVANGSTRYTYNTAGYLTKVENFTTEWQTQSEMTYDGLGNRLEVTTYSDGEGNTTRYVLDGGAELTAIGTDNTTYYLYGLGAIGTLGESWSYMLQDGAGSTRQLVDEEGAVNLSVSYTPWGDTMEIYGSGMLNLGYLGGVYDAGTGLIYMGNGQYYDPGTGRFLTRGAQQDQSNPYTPWNSDPAGMLIAPLSLYLLLTNRKKQIKKNISSIMLIAVLLIVGFSISAYDSSASFGESTNSFSYIDTPPKYVGEIYSATVMNIMKSAEPGDIAPILDECTEYFSRNESKNPAATQADEEQIKRIEDTYHVKITGTGWFWYDWLDALEEAIETVDAKLSEKLGSGGFSKVYGEGYSFHCVDDQVSFGFTYFDHLGFRKLYSNYYNGSVRVIIHELGHAFDYSVCNNTRGKCYGFDDTSVATVRVDLDNARKGKKLYFAVNETDLGLTFENLDRNDYGDSESNPPYHGFAGGKEVWQFAMDYNNGFEDSGEIWADSYLGWIYDNLSGDRRAYMNYAMNYYLQIFKYKDGK